MNLDRSSLRNFPPDLLLGFGVPFFAISLLCSFFLSLEGWPWLVAFLSTLFVAAFGAVQLFRAKLPLYRNGCYFTWGARALPPRSVALYRLGCRLSIAGIFFAVLLLLPRLVQIL